MSPAMCRALSIFQPPKEIVMAASASLQKPVLPFAQTQEKTPSESIASDHSLLEIDRELDILFDTMQDELEETGEAS